MYKNQKIWTSILIAWLLLSEVLWGPILGVLNFVLNSSIKTIFGNSQFINNYPFFSHLVIILELISIIGLIKLFKGAGKYKLSKGWYISFSIILWLLLLSLLLAWYMILSFNNYLS